MGTPNFDTRPILSFFFWRVQKCCQINHHLSMNELILLNVYMLVNYASQENKFWPTNVLLLEWTGNENMYILHSTSVYIVIAF